MTMMAFGKKRNQSSNRWLLTSTLQYERPSKERRGENKRCFLRKLPEGSSETRVPSRGVGWGGERRKPLREAWSRELPGAILKAFPVQLSTILQPSCVAFSINTPRGKSSTLKVNIKQKRALGGKKSIRSTVNRR